MTEVVEVILAGTNTVIEVITPGQQGAKGEDGASTIEAEAAAAAALISEQNASDSEDAAAASAAAALISENNASTSEGNAATSAAAALVSQNSASTSATNAGTSESNAGTSAAAALVSENNASTSATNAGTSEGNAATSAAAALVSQNSATTSATNAGTSAGNASTSAAAALVSENNASTSEGNAGTSAAAALVSQGAASTSETNAGNSATAASASAAAALISANNASTSEGNASGSASAASTSAAAALTSETNAGNSATASAGSALAASGSASASSTSAANALTSEGNAATSASNAATSASNASDDADQTALDAIQTAADAVVTAADRAAIEALTPHQNNTTAIIPPTATDDSSLGYSVGSFWIDIVGIESYRCIKDGIGIALWVKTTLSTDELATVAISGSSDDLVQGAVQLLMTAAERVKLGNIEANATADQSAAEVSFSNLASGLTATNVQGAIDETESRVDALEAVGVGLGGSTGVTDNALLRADGAGGATVQSSGITVDDSDNLATSGEVTVKGIPVHQFLGDQATTGSIDGGILTVNVDPTKFDISDGSGIIVDAFTDPQNPVLNLVDWSGLVATIPAHSATLITYVAINSSGVVVQQATPFSPEQERDLINIGVVVTLDTVNISSIGSAINSSRGQGYLPHDGFDAIGPINIAGNNFFAAASNLTMTKSAGETFQSALNIATSEKNPNFLTSALASPTSFTYGYRDGVGGSTVILSQTNIDPEQYDDGSGTLQTVPNNRWTNQRIYFFPSTGDMVVIYGQEVYTNLTAARNAVFTEQVIENSDLNPGAIRTIVTVKKGETDLSSVDTFFTDTGKFGFLAGGAGSTSGGILQDLQNTYDNSVNPEVLTDSTRGALTVRRGSTLESDNIYEGQNNAGSTVFGVTGEGNLVLSGTVDGRDVDADGTKLDGISSGAEVNAVDSVNGETGVVVLDADNISDAATTNKFTTAGDISKLSGIESNAKDDQTSAEVSYDNTISGLTATDVKAAIDEVAAAGGGSSITFTDTTLSGNLALAIDANQIQRITATTSGSHSVTLPDPTATEVGKTIEILALTTSYTNQFWFDVISKPTSGVTLTKMYHGAILRVVNTGTEWQPTSPGAKTDSSVSLFEDTIVLGHGARGEEGGIGLGTDSLADRNGVSIGKNSQGQNESIGIGNNAKSQTNGVAIGLSTSANNGSCVAIGDNAGTASGFCVAIGHDSLADGGSSVALGDSTDALGSNSVAVGQGAQATNTSTLAVGQGASASGNEATAIGRNAFSAGDNGYSFGQNATASGDDSISVGHNSDATMLSSIAVGNASDALGSYSVAIGAAAASTMLRGIAIGDIAKATNQWAVAIGYNAQTAGESSVALGRSSTASGQNAVSIGINSDAINTGTVAIGVGAQAVGTDSVAIGQNAATSSSEGVSVGANSDAGNRSVAVGDGAQSSDDGTAFGWQANAGTDAVVLGWNASGSSQFSIVLGTNSTSNTERGIAIGAYSVVTRSAETTTSIDFLNNFPSKGMMGDQGWAGSTTSVSSLEILCGGIVGKRCTIKASSAYMFEIKVVGFDTVANESCAFKFTGLIQRDAANNTTFVGLPNKEILAKGNAAFDCTVEEDNVNEALIIKVTAASINLTRWSAKGSFVEAVL